MFKQLNLWYLWNYSNIETTLHVVTYWRENHNICYRNAIFFIEENPIDDWGW